MNLNTCNNCGGNYEYRGGRYVCRACGSYRYENLSDEEKTAVHEAAKMLFAGDFDGAEVVQLYLWDMEANRVSRPLRELKDFKRVELKKGESKVVEFEITEEMLRFLNYNGEIASEPGRFTAYIGESSAIDRKIQFTLKHK